MVRRRYRRVAILVLVAIVLSLLPVRTLVPGDLALDSFLRGLLPQTSARADTLPAPPTPRSATRAAATRKLGTARPGRP